MAVSVTGPEIERLIQLLARLPGLGPRSARRAALTLIKKRDQLMVPLAEAVKIASERVAICSTCGNVDTVEPCTLCRDHSRDGSILVVVEDVGDLWALERPAWSRRATTSWAARLSPLDGVGPEDLAIERLVARVAEGGVTEVVIALNATVDGQTTAHYVTDLLAATGVKVTRLAHGVPVGGELDYLDEGTLAAAMRSRTPF